MGEQEVQWYIRPILHPAAPVFHTGANCPTSHLATCLWPLGKLRSMAQVLGTLHLCGNLKEGPGSQLQT